MPRWCWCIYGQDSRSVEPLLAAKQMLGDRLVGVVLNAVTPDEVESLEQQVVPALQTSDWWFTG